MPHELWPADLPALTRGASYLGSGGAGPAELGARLLLSSGRWPLRVHDVDELPAATPCVALAYVGSTLILTERLPPDDPFAVAIAAVERWLGTADSAVCLIEAAGMNAVLPLTLAHTRRLVDADCMGRGLPDLDQISLLVDGLDGLVAAVPTGGDGVLVAERARPGDLERIVRTAVECHGGWTPLALGGFTVADLVEHALPGTLRRAAALGAAALGADDGSPQELASALGARLLGGGRVAQIDAEDPGVTTITLHTAESDVLRLIARSEFVAAMTNGVTEAASPGIVVALDAGTRMPLEVGQLRPAMDVFVLALPAPAWWTARPDRRALVEPERWGLVGLREGE